MDNAITFTPAELIGFISGVCGVIISLGAVVTLFIKAVSKMREPERKQNETLKDHEDRLKVLEEKDKLYNQYFENDNNRFKNIEDGFRMVVSALHALLKQAVDGNAVEQLKDEKKGVEDYLYNK